jgi:hypothetical protein
MADRLSPAPEGKQPKPKAAPFKPGGKAAALPQPNFADLAPRTEAEPAVEQGIDLSGVPKIVMAAGRGKTGKTTLLRWISEASLAGGSGVILADIDPSNASYSLYFDDVARPDTDSFLRAIPSPSRCRPSPLRLERSARFMRPVRTPSLRLRMSSAPKPIRSPARRSTRFTRPALRSSTSSPLASPPRSKTQAGSVSKPCARAPSSARRRRLLLGRVHNRPDARRGLGAHDRGGDGRRTGSSERLGVPDGGQ